MANEVEKEDDCEIGEVDKELISASFGLWTSVSFGLWVNVDDVVLGCVLCINEEEEVVEEVEEEAAAFVGLNTTNPVFDFISVETSFTSSPVTVAFVGATAADKDEEDVLDLHINSTIPVSLDILSTVTELLSSVVSLPAVLSFSGNA